MDQSKKIKEKEIEAKSKKEITESIVDEEIEGVAIAVVSELVIGGRKLLEALRSYAGEVACEFRVLRQKHRPARHEAVDQRLLPHRNPRREKSSKPRKMKNRGFLSLN